MLSLWCIFKGKDVGFIDFCSLLLGSLVLWKIVYCFILCVGFSSFVSLHQCLMFARVIGSITFYKFGINSIF